MLKPHTVTRYLQRHADPSVGAFLQHLGAAEVTLGVYQSAVIVPVFAEESAQFLRLFTRLIAAQAPRLLICVVNERSDASSAQAEQNRQFVRDLLQVATHVRCIQERHAYLLGGLWPQLPGLDVLLLDITHGPFALVEKEGVGRARKIAADVALALHVAGRLSSRFVGSSDADAQLPVNYFEFLERSHDAAALVFPFEHHAPVGTAPRLVEGMAQVEATFRYYVLGLSFAGSPYGYHSLGSAMGFSLPHYAAVRGFPNRQAGEDFYLLSKLAQLGPVARIDNTPIMITTRLSARIPFGTGPRLEQWLKDANTTNGQNHKHGQVHRISTWDPDLFVALRELLGLLGRWASEGHATPSCATGWIEGQAQEIFARLAPALRGCPSAQHRVRRLHEQVDALCTLRWLNRQTRERFPPVPFDDALRRAAWLGLWPEETAGDAHAALAGLRRVESLLDRHVGP